jgi:hypothetical protein
MPREGFVLPAALVDELRDRANVEGVPVSAVVGRLLREQLPPMLAELLAQRMADGWRDCPALDSARWYWPPSKAVDPAVRAAAIDVRSSNREHVP